VAASARTAVHGLSVLLAIPWLVACGTDRTVPADPERSARPVTCPTSSATAAAPSSAPDVSPGGRAFVECTEETRKGELRQLAPIPSANTS
jgi:hypothetical protein